MKENMISILMFLTITTIIFDLDRYYINVWVVLTLVVFGLEFLKELLE